MEQQDHEKPILDDYIMTVIGNCLNGLKRSDCEGDGWKVKAYWAGKILRVDISSDKWAKNNLIPL